MLVVFDHEIEKTILFSLLMISDNRWCISHSHHCHLNSCTRLNLILCIHRKTADWNSNWMHTFETHSWNTFRHFSYTHFVSYTHIDSLKGGGGYNRKSTTMHRLGKLVIKKLKSNIFRIFNKILIFIKKRSQICQIIMPNNNNLPNNNICQIIMSVTISTTSFFLQN